LPFFALLDNTSDAVLESRSVRLPWASDTAALGPISALMFRLVAKWAIGSGMGLLAELE
jgi:hypothetical protein